MNRFAVFVITGLALLNAGCAAEAQTHAYVAEPVAYYEPPPLIMVEPGIYVLRDSAVPVYYMHGSYWSYSGGGWYRARHWRDPWVSVGINMIPPVIAHRDHHRYVRYHGHPHSYVYREPGQPRRGNHYRGPARPQRAERSYRPAQPSIQHQPAPAPARVERVPSSPSRIERSPSPAPSRIERAPSSPQRIERNSRPSQPKVEPRRSAPPKADSRRRPR